MVMYLCSQIKPFRLKFFDFRGERANFYYNHIPFDFVEEIRYFFLKPNSKGLAEEIVKRWFKKNGYSVSELYKQKGCQNNLDLLVKRHNKRGMSFQVEAKTHTDRLSSKQLELAIRNKGMIVWVEWIE